MWERAFESGAVKKESGHGIDGCVWLLWIGSCPVSPHFVASQTGSNRSASRLRLFLDYNYNMRRCESGAHPDFCFSSNGIILGGF